MATPFRWHGEGPFSTPNRINLIRCINKDGVSYPAVTGSEVESFVGVSYTGSTLALGASRQGSIPCTPTKNWTERNYK